MLDWQLTRLGVHCEVVAPTLVPVKAGDRVKTDRRDAERLARSYGAEDLTAVWVPDAAHEALRDLVRARDAEVTADSPTRQRTSRRLDSTIIALLYFAADRFWFGSRETGRRDAAAPVATIAVLSFRNMIADPAIEVLARRIAETLLTMPSPVPQLRVISRNSSFSYQGQEGDRRSSARGCG